MDKLESFREIIIETLNNYGKVQPKDLPDVSVQISTDKVNDHYHLHYVGWDKMKRIYTCVFHLDIIKDKIWLQVNNSNYDIALELVERGIPKSDIVLGFQAPYKRQYTEFAVA
ncbi:MAG: XisI protein [Leptospiraceae bacterium]|nr:XisI protein [Leptospiraceae bacterium]MCP5500980.1 XisI protein [Leptospiraceae bacterium]